MSVQASIEKKISERLNPAALEVVNESHRHNVPPGSESHFKITVVSDAFDGQPLIARHRLLNELLGEYLRESVHAIALHTHTPQEWDARNQTSRPSPPCHSARKP